MTKVAAGQEPQTVNVWAKCPDPYTSCGPTTETTAEAAPVASAAAPVAAAAAAGDTRVLAETTPPDAKLGECYTRVMNPAVYKDEPVQELKRAAYDTTTYSEPEYADVQEQVLVTPASKRLEVVPAEYQEVEEKVLVRAAYTREIQIPALYNTTYEQVLERPARQVWKPGRGAVEKVDEVTGEILCLVEEPAQYKTVEKKELARAATTKSEEVPAEYATVTKTTLKTAETVREIEVPAVYETRTVRKQVKAPQATKQQVPAEFTTVNKKVLVTPESYEWTQVLCEENATAGKIMEVEKALQEQGYAVTNIDGLIDKELNDALLKFQTDKGLRQTGLMTERTLAALGVPLR